MKDHIKIISWLMLLIHLASGALLQAAPPETAHVVFKKVCKRKSQLSETSDQQTNSEMLATTSENDTHHHPKTEIDLCSVTMAPPPVPVSVVPSSTFYLAETAPFLPVYYHFLSTSEEPDPPRFA